MFTSLGLFDSVKCPEGPACGLLNCIFSHPDPSDTAPAVPNKANVVEKHRPSSTIDIEPPRKRLRSGEHDPGQQPAHGTDVRDPKKPPPRPSNAVPPTSQRSTYTPVREATIKQPSSNASVLTSAGPSPEGSPLVRAKRARKLKDEPLVPRLLPKNPAPFAMRNQLVALLFDQVARLNDDVKASDEPFKAALEMSRPEMIAYVLDEEERVAKTQPAIYGNVLKLRVVALKKMGRKEWRAEREKQIAREFPGMALTPTKNKDALVEIETGLTAAEENALLPNLVTPLDGLAPHGYVLKPPTSAEVDEARAAVTAANGWEACDRCRTRFQVFPGRRPTDGALASGSACTYHYGKSRRPQRDKGSTAANGAATEQYTCCGREVGAPGCTSAATHVFKASDPKRLAVATPFVRTEGKGEKAGGAVAVDCEMAYTTMGMELVRLTVTAWPGGAELVDVLVRPVGEILDINTRFSGVQAADMAKAKPYDGIPSAGDNSTQADGTESGGLRIVESPAAARALLLRHLSPRTPLIGHALENDLCAVRLCHATAVDTVLLYPHPRGLPVRHGLRALVERHLGRQIQTGGAQGHDSKEDARAAGDLVRLKVAEKWRAMRREGWRVEGGVFFAPEEGADRGEALDPTAKV